MSINVGVQPLNNFSEQFTVQPPLSNAAITIASASMLIKRPVVMSLADDSEPAPFAMVVAVANDPDKIKQLESLVQSWGG